MWFILRQFGNIYVTFLVILHLRRFVLDRRIYSIVPNQLLPYLIRHQMLHAQLRVTIQERQIFPKTDKFKTSLQSLSVFSSGSLYSQHGKTVYIPGNTWSLPILIHTIFVHYFLGRRWIRFSMPSMSKSGGNVFGKIYAVENTHLYKFSVISQHKQMFECILNQIPNLRYYPFLNYVYFQRLYLYGYYL